MTFGQRIKQLRKSTCMTQERLAELLSISPQAVSRWENDTAMPDISLIPPLANLFNVTTDYLFGMDTYEKEQRRAEYEREYKDYWRNEDKERNYEIARKAVEEYPGDMHYLEWLASSEYYVALPNSDDQEGVALLESSVKHYKQVLRSNPEHNLESRALCGIVYVLHALGDNDAAKEYAMRIKDDDKRSEMMVWALTGIEKQKYAQEVCEGLINKFFAFVTFCGNSKEACRITEEMLLLLFPDGNYLYFNNLLQYNSITKAIIFVEENKYDEAFCELRKSKEFAYKMREYRKLSQYSFTSPLFCHLNGTKQSSEEYDDIQDYRDCLINNVSFDPIRKRDEFIDLIS